MTHSTAEVALREAAMVLHRSRAGLGRSGPATPGTGRGTRVAALVELERLLGEITEVVGGLAPPVGRGAEHGEDFADLTEHLWAAAAVAGTLTGPPTT